MNTIETLAEFFGWCTILNVAFLALAAILLMAAGSTLARIHSKMFGVSEGDLPSIYFNYMAHYQTAIVVFNLMPYIALKLIS